MIHESGVLSGELVVLLLLVFVIGIGAIARRFQTPYPILMVIGGLLLCWMPHLPRITLDPDIVFLVILPPLLFEAAYETSWREFRYHSISIFMLAFGLVGFTTVGVSLAAHWIIPGFDWRMGLALGAIISPTDAIAATAIARRLGLPNLISDTLEGESLVNDATGLLMLRFAIAAVTAGTPPSLGQGATELIYLVAGGIVVGLVVAKIVYTFETWIDNGPIEVTASIVTPFLAYLGAEAIHSSGVLGAVACGLYLGRRSSSYLSSAVRIQAASTWRSLTFVLNGIVFVLIGLQLPYILREIRSLSTGQLAFSAAVTIIVVILLRLLWVYPGAYLSQFVRQHVLKQHGPQASPREIFVIGWTGMRGVVSLAAAFSLPTTLDDGSPFPQRNVIVFITFCVIFVTLVLQGLTLPAFIRALGLSGAERSNEEELNARRQMIQAALEELDNLRESDEPEFDEVYDDLQRHYSRRREAIDESYDGHRRPASATRLRRRYNEVRRRLMQVERATAVKMRDENDIDDKVLRKLEREIDLLDAHYERRP